MGIPTARSRVACPAVGQAKADHPACSRQEGQADLSAVLSAVASKGSRRGQARNSEF